MSPVRWMMRALQPAKRVPIGALLGLVLLLGASERALAEPPQGFLLHPAPKAVPELAFSDGEIFYTLREAVVVIEEWRHHYNTARPHSALGWRPPAPEAIVPMDPRPVMH